MFDDGAVFFTYLQTRRNKEARTNKTTWMKLPWIMKLWIMMMMMTMMKENQPRKAMAQ